MVQLLFRFHIQSLSIGKYYSEYHLYRAELLPANEVWGKVICSKACVKNSVHRRGVPGRGAGVPALGGCLVETPPGRLLLRAVRILLECILFMN